jgi:P27 family predicted phage terminase small subunit
MGRRGPPPKPTALKVLAGNPGKKPLNAREPQPQKIAPRCPEWLTGEGRATWRRLTGLLKGMRLLTNADADAMAGYCQTYARWREAEQFLSVHGLVFPLRDEKGRVRCMLQFPQVAIARNALLLLKGYQQEFGLTPASRSRIAIHDEPDRSSDAYRWLA